MGICLDEYDRIARQVAENLEKFIEGTLSQKDLQKTIPENYKLGEGVMQTESTEEDIKMKQKFWTLDAWIEHFVGNYIQTQMK